MGWHENLFSSSDSLALNPHDTSTHLFTGLTFKPTTSASAPRRLTG